MKEIEDMVNLAGGINPIKRIETLNALATSSKRVREFRFRGTNRDFPVVSVKISFPVYRIENHRTQSLQKEYLATHSDVCEDFFQTDKDSLAVQKVQDEILRRLIFEKDLLDKFSDSNVRQDEPIVCTREGVVVNGNRRLCAWRKLYEEDPSKYGHFQSIEVMLLPDDTDEEDINNIERELQIRPTLRSEYSWHARAFMIKEDFARYPLAELAKRYDSSMAEIKLTQDCLSYAKQYLESIGKPDQWSLVDKQEYAFKKIVKEQNRIQNLAEKQVFQACVSAVLQVNKDEIGNRRYDLIPQIAKNINPIIEVLKREIPPPDEPEVEDPLGMYGAFDLKQKEWLFKISNECCEVGNAKKTVEMITSVINTINERTRDKTASLQLLMDLQDISTKLISVKNRDLDDRQEDFPGIIRQLESINRACEFIKKWVDEHANRT